MRSTPANSDGNDDLSAWLDGELGEAEMAELEAELARDPALRAELAELEAVVRFVRDEAPVPAPDDFERRLAARIAAENPEHAGFGARSAEGWSSWWRRPLGIPLEGWALTLAAAAALLIAWRVPALVGGAVPDDGGERELSPAAVEPPSTPLRSPDPGAPSKDAPPEVIGRATTDPRAEAKKVVSTPGIDAAPPVADGVPEGAPDAVPAPSPGLELPLAQAVAPDGKPDGKPDGTADGDGSLRYVVHAEDGGVKLELLKIAGRYGWSVVDSAGAIVSTGRMAGSTEDLVLSLPQADLARLDAELGAKGHAVEHVGGGDLVGGSHVRVRITLAVDAADPGVGTAKKAVPVDESTEGGINAPDAAAPTRR